MIEKNSYRITREFWFNGGLTTSEVVTEGASIPDVLKSLLRDLDIDPATIVKVERII